ncbi:hypothetical protein NECAME_02189 [Necator americanus]|uniref:Phosphatidylinositol-3-phosphatase SAC1 n=1 Tax=Necator americanus TaxID=51031 RepID=W2TJE5_NECAM|nr:hypothetical protein NECAME_02189 [Necator americanus]ETN81147.1 hypothetical protein NECAME_02189 [Necator americanus]
MSTDVYEGFNLYTLAEKFYLEPRDRDGNLLSQQYLEIDRHSNQIRVSNASVNRIPLADADIQYVHGLLGIIPIVSGMALIVIRKSRLVGRLNGHPIYTITETDIIPYKKTTLHLTEKQIWYNRHFTEMLQTVLAISGFYFSYSIDLSRSLQWLSENGTPAFKETSMIERVSMADDRFVWNTYLLSQLRLKEVLTSYPVSFFWFLHLTRSKFGLLRAGVRFYKRGVSIDGHPANFVETEQIVETVSIRGRRLTSFLQVSLIYSEVKYVFPISVVAIQMRGSIPLLWSQRPNLKWQPMPTMKASDDQLSAYVRHFENQRKTYGGYHVIVNLINQTGREKKIGSELERIVQQANLNYVRYNPFDFHKECHAMQWHRISLLKDQLRQEITQFGFFAASDVLAESDLTQRSQTGFFRTNCMDCLDRTNVVQAMIARESLTDQLYFLGILVGGQRVETCPDLEASFKHLWADNGDECSRQYAGTGALKADFTRLGKRTYTGVINDGINAITRYIRNNFADGYRQDAMDVFLGNYIVDVHNLPSSLEATLISLDQNGIALLAACFAMAMTILCILVAENISATLFWLAVFLVCMMFIFLNGEDFVNAPKLKRD